MKRMTEEEELFRRKYGHVDKRTVQYLNAVLRSIGVVGDVSDFAHVSHKPPLREEEVMYQYTRPTLAGYETIEIGQKNGKWVVQTAMASGDELVYIFFVFNRRPSMKDIKTALLVDRLYQAFWFGTLSPVFTCWECGRETHWLDTAGKTLEEKVEMLQEKYCGC
jgi:hypothetical protein